MDKTLWNQKIGLPRLVSPFSNVEKSEIIEVADHFRVRKYKNRDVILYQGDTTNVVYVIQCGRYGWSGSCRRMTENFVQPPFKQ